MGFFGIEKRMLITWEIRDRFSSNFVKSLFQGFLAILPNFVFLQPVEVEIQGHAKLHPK